MGGSAVGAALSVWAISVRAEATMSVLRPHRGQNSASLGIAAEHEGHRGEEPCICSRY